MHKCTCTMLWCAEALGQWHCWVVTLYMFCECINNHILWKTSNTCFFRFNIVRTSLRSSKCSAQTACVGTLGLVWTCLEIASNWSCLQPPCMQEHIHPHNDTRPATSKLEMLKRTLPLILQEFVQLALKALPHRGAKLFAPIVSAMHLWWRHGAATETN